MWLIRRQRKRRNRQQTKDTRLQTSVPKFQVYGLRSVVYSLNKGFTLIELMVSASILGFIGLAILTTFGSGFHVYERVQSYGGLQADALLSLEEMERDLRSAFPFSTIGFEGSAQKIAFPAMIETVEMIEDEERIVPSVGKVSYYIKEDNEQSVLIRDQWGYSQAGKAQAKEYQSSLLTYVKELQLSYYYFDEENSEYGWKESWSEEDENLPAAVKIELTFEDRGQDIQLVRTVLVPSVWVAREKEEGEEEESEGEDDA